MMFDGALWGFRWPPNIPVKLLILKSIYDLLTMTIKGIVAQQAFASDDYGRLIKKRMALAEVKDYHCWHQYHTLYPKVPSCEHFSFAHFYYNLLDLSF